MAEQVAEATEVADFGEEEFVDDFAEGAEAAVAEDQAEGFEQELDDEVSPDADTEQSTVESDGEAATDEVAEADDVEFPSEVLEAAGLTAAEAKERFGSPDKLEAAVEFFDQQMLKAGREARVQSEPESAKQEPEEAPEKEPEPVKQDSLAEFEIDESKWDDETVAEFKRLADFSRSQVDSVRQEFASQVEGFQAMLTSLAEERATERLDNFVRDLPEAWAEVFGKGDIRAIQKGSPEFTARAKLQQAALDVMEGRRLNGQEPLPPDELLTRALRAEFGNKAEAIVKDQVTKQASQRRKQFTARPSGRKAAEMNPDQAAGQFAAQWAKDRGIPSVPDYDSDLGDEI